MKNYLNKLALLWAVPAFFVSLGAKAQTADEASESVSTFTLNITPDGASTLTCFLPSQPSGRAVVACPGGGYSHLAMEHEGTQWAPFFNRLGIAYFVLKYRMPQGNRNIPLGDAYQAIRTVRDSAQAWHINAADIGIMGSSAGGHLASAVSTHAPADARPNFTILFYPVISMDEHVTHRGSVVGFLGDERSNKTLVDEFSSDKAVSAPLTPPAIILTSGDDRVVPPATNSIAYYSAMWAAGIPCALHVYPSGGHGWGCRTNFAYHEQMTDELAQWLKTLKTIPKQ